MTGDHSYDINSVGNYSFLYHNGLPAQHDLLVFGRTNSCFTDTSIKWNTDLGVGTGVRDIYAASPYNLTLRPTTDYSDATNGALWLMQDNEKTFRSRIDKNIQ